MSTKPRVSKPKVAKKKLDTEIDSGNDESDNDNSTINKPGKSRNKPHFGGNNDFDDGDDGDNDGDNNLNRKKKNQSPSRAESPQSGDEAAAGPKKNQHRTPKTKQGVGEGDDELGKGPGSDIDEPDGDESRIADDGTFAQEEEEEPNTSRQPGTARKYRLQDLEDEIAEVDTELKKAERNAAIAKEKRPGISIDDPQMQKDIEAYAKTLIARQWPGKIIQGIQIIAIVGSVALVVVSVVGSVILCVDLATPVTDLVTAGLELMGGVADIADEVNESKKSKTQAAERKGLEALEGLTAIKGGMITEQHLKAYHNFRLKAAQRLKEQESQKNGSQE